jgi:hypothetical protein
VGVVVDADLAVGDVKARYIAAGKHGAKTKLPVGAAAACFVAQDADRPDKVGGV